MSPDANKIVGTDCKEGADILWHHCVRRIYTCISASLEYIHFLSGIYTYMYADIYVLAYD